MLRFALVVLDDGTVAATTTTRLGPELGDDHGITLSVRVSDEEVHSEDDLGENIENAINDDFRISRDLSLALRQRENDRIRSP